MKIIAGLGNPDREYAGTRHNIGFDAITAISDKTGISVTEKKFKGLIGKGTLCGQKVILLKPLTYMNLSGESIIEAMNFFKLEPKDVCVIYDDVNLEPGFIRVREKGSAGGHNGIKNIILHLGSENFPRIRIGVGEKPKEWDLKDYVMGHFSREDEVKIRSALQDAVTAAELFAVDDIARAMNTFNRKKTKTDE